MLPALGACMRYDGMMPREGVRGCPMSDHSEEKTYRIGEVAEMLNLKTHVLRFWETEFPQLAPLRTGKGQRLYTEDHIGLLRRIQQLLHEQGMTLRARAACCTAAPYWTKACLSVLPQCRTRTSCACSGASLRRCAVCSAASRRIAAHRAKAGQKTGQRCRKRIGPQQGNRAVRLPDHGAGKHPPQRRGAASARAAELADEGSSAVYLHGWLPKQACKKF